MGAHALKEGGKRLGNIKILLHQNLMGLAKILSIKHRGEQGVSLLFTGL